MALDGAYLRMLKPEFEQKAGRRSLAPDRRESGTGWRVAAHVNTGN